MSTYSIFTGYLAQDAADCPGIARNHQNKDASVFFLNHWVFCADQIFLFILFISNLFINLFFSRFQVEGLFERQRDPFPLPAPQRLTSSSRFEADSGGWRQSGEGKLFKFLKFLDKPLMFIQYFFILELRFSSYILICYKVW